MNATDTIAIDTPRTFDLATPIRTLLTALAVLLTLVLAPMASTPAEAGFGKKAKFAGKMFGKLEKAGRKMSRKKGLVGKLGKGLRAGGRAGRKGAGKIGKGTKFVKRGVRRGLSKSKAGRGVLKAGKAYKNARKSTLNRAFKRCRADFCNDARDAVDAYVPG